ncbi:phage holin family protein [Klebsiella grimontii]|uniref:phage holin family protein n=1 Tax=Klebsiella grimontii TaxID=2058152 RepID=UPI001CCEEA67|nr:phage holin family protein [Klebsiella grimontii]MBZ7671965.1 hypothetical protein [Klebsiella grimontii]
MSVPAQIETPKAILLEMEILFTVIATGAWGGFVSYLMKSNAGKTSNMHKGIISCLTQIVISCFTSFLVSAIAIEKGLSLNMILLFAGIGGVFAVPILKIVGAKVRQILNSNDLLK